MVPNFITLAAAVAQTNAPEASAAPSSTPAKKGKSDKAASGAQGSSYIHGAKKQSGKKETLSIFGIGAMALTFFGKFTAQNTSVVEILKTLIRGAASAGAISDTVLNQLTETQFTKSVMKLLKDNNGLQQTIQNLSTLDRLGDALTGQTDENRKFQEVLYSYGNQGSSADRIAKALETAGFTTDQIKEAIPLVLSLTTMRLDIETVLKNAQINPDQLGEDELKIFRREFEAVVQRVIAHPELIYSDIIAPAVASNTITIQSSGRLTSADLEAVKKALSEYFFERVNGTTGLALADSNASPQTEIRSQRWYGNIYQFLVQEGQNLIENTQTDYEKMKNLVEVFSEELAAEGYREITAQDIKIIVEIFNAQKGALYANESMDTDLAKTMRTLAGQKKIPGYLATPQSNIEAARAAVASVLAGPLAKTYQGVLHEAAFLPRHEISLLASVGTRFAAAIDGFAPLVLSPKVVTSQLANGTQAVEAMINVSEFASAVPVTDTLERLRGKITGPVNLDAYIAAAQAHGDIHTATHLIALREASKSSGARPLNDAFIRNYLEVAASAGKPEQLAKTLLLQAKARAEGQSTLRAASVRALPEHREGAKVVELGPESAKEIVHPTKPKAALPPLPITGKK